MSLPGSLESAGRRPADKPLGSDRHFACGRRQSLVHDTSYIGRIACRVQRTLNNATPGAPGRTHPNNLPDDGALLHTQPHSYGMTGLPGAADQIVCVDLTRPEPACQSTVPV